MRGLARDCSTGQPTPNAIAPRVRVDPESARSSPKRLRSSDGTVNPSLLSNLAQRRRLSKRRRESVRDAGYPRLGISAVRPFALCATVSIVVAVANALNPYRPDTGGDATASHRRLRHTRPPRVCSLRGCQRPFRSRSREAKAILSLRQSPLGAVTAAVIPLGDAHVMTDQPTLQPECCSSARAVHAGTK